MGREGGKKDRRNKRGVGKEGGEMGKDEEGKE